MIRLFCSYCLFVLLSTTSLVAVGKRRVDVVAYNYCYIPVAEETYVHYTKMQEEYDVRFYLDLYAYVENFVDAPDLHKVIFIDFCISEKLAKIPQNKLICCKWEAAKALPIYYDSYYRVYTFDDDLVDNKKFFKFCYPVLRPMLDHMLPFAKKKFCVMVAGNFQPPERREMVHFFNTKPKDEFDLYGVPLPEFCQFSKGFIEGFPSSHQKLELISNYRFGICFENTHTTKGYITEKIFDYFAAGCVPVYWGPDNVTDFIPPSCFIDYRQFNNNEEMYAFLQAMTEKQYNQYLKNIRTFLNSAQAYIFSEEYFESLLMQALSE